MLDAKHESFVIWYIKTKFKIDEGMVSTTATFVMITTMNIGTWILFLWVLVAEVWPHIFVDHFLYLIQRHTVKIKVFKMLEMIGECYFVGFHN